MTSTTTIIDATTTRGYLDFELVFVKWFDQEFGGSPVGDLVLASHNFGYLRARDAAEQDKKDLRRRIGALESELTERQHRVIELRRELDLVRAELQASKSSANTSSSDDFRSKNSGNSGNYGDFFKSMFGG